MGLGRKAQGQRGGSPALHLIWVKLVLTFSSLSHCFSSPVKGEWTLGFPGQSTGTWITPEAVGSLPAPASSSLMSAMLWCMWSLDTTLKQGVEKDRSISAWRGVNENESDKKHSQTQCLRDPVLAAAARTHPVQPVGQHQGLALFPNSIKQRIHPSVEVFKGSAHSNYYYMCKRKECAGLPSCPLLYAGPTELAAPISLIKAGLALHWPCKGVRWVSGPRATPSSPVLNRGCAAGRLPVPVHQELSSCSDALSPRTAVLMLAPPAAPRASLVAG